MNNSKNALIQYDGSRKNNFTGIRILFAWLVLYGHSYAIQKTVGIRDPLNILFQGSVWIGEIAVNGFFAISGFLVAASFINRGLKDYAISRILRIIPALFLCVLLTVFFLGPIFTNLSLREFFLNSQTYAYLSNGFAIFKVEWILPGVFEDNIRPAVNGSLWSLPVEARCYLILAVIGFFGLLKDRTLANLCIISVFLFGVIFFSEIPLIGGNSKWARPSMYFLIGVFFFINRDRVILDHRLAFLAVILIFSSFGEEWFLYVFPLSFVYLIFYTAYATKYINFDKKIGDISYGIYIYAWPVQQIVADIFPQFTPSWNTIISSLMVIPTAFISWRYIEKPILGYKKRLLGKTDGYRISHILRAFRLIKEKG